MPEIVLTDEHRYYVDGIEYDGVTTIIQLEGGMPGIEFCDPWYAERGSMIHLATAFYDRGTLDESSVDERIKGFLESWKWFRDKHPSGYAPQNIELKLSDHVYRYCGTLDRLPLLDIKSGVYKKADLAQIGAYYGLCQANKVDRDLYMGPEARKVVYLNEDGSYPTVNQYSIKETMLARDSFLSALNWHRFKNTK